MGMFTLIMETGGLGTTPQMTLTFLSDTIQINNNNKYVVCSTLNRSSRLATYHTKYVRRSTWYDGK